MITDNEIKELLVSNAIEWNKEESQDRAFIYVDDFVKELQAKLKLLGIGVVVGRSGQLKAEVFKLANKLAVAGEGDAAVAMHIIHNRL